MTKTTYGVISDVHKHPRIVPYLVQKLGRERVDAVILNGDLGEDREMICQVLFDASRLGVDTYVQPGSHENIADYTQAFDYLSERNSNLVNMLENPKIERDGHHLVFLPGSDFRAGGQYLLTHEDIPNGNYLQTQEGLRPITNILEATAHLKTTKALLNVTNMNTLDDLVTDPEKTVVICHVPPKFNDLKKGIDMAYFVERNSDGSVFPGVVMETQIRDHYGEINDTDLRLIATQNGLTFKRENRGNEPLRDVYERNGITKAISGHFHESAHRAHDLECNPIEEGKKVDSLFFNAGMADDGKAGIFVVDDNKISYRRISLE